MASRTHLSRQRVLGRRLRLERLEDRSLLASTIPFLPIIGDDAGHLYQIANLETSPTLTFLGTMDRPMDDIVLAPSGTLYGVSRNFGISSLYTIPVNFASPGGLIATTAVGTIIYNGNFVAVNSLDTLTDGSLLAAGLDASAQSRLFSINPATAAATSPLSLGAFVPAGDLNFDSTGFVYLTTANGRLLRINPALTTVTDVGSTGFNDFFGLSHGAGSTLFGYRFNRDAHEINTTDATTTLLGTLAAQPGDPALTGILAATTLMAPVELGTVDFRLLAGETPFAGRISYRFTAAHTGTFTADLPGQVPPPNVQLWLYREVSPGNLQFVGNAANRLDAAVTAGQVYVLRLIGAPATLDVRLTNLVNATGNTTTVFGTSAADTFTFTPGNPFTITIKGVSYQINFNGALPLTVSFDGAGGTNTATINGAAVAETATFNIQTRTGQVTATNRQVNLTNTDVMSFLGGGAGDTASLTGSTSADTITLAPQSATVASGVRSASVGGVPTINVDGGGGTDTATYTGTAAVDNVVLQFHQGNFTNGANTIALTNCTNITAVSGGGADTAQIYDSTAVDTFTANANGATMFRPGVYTLSAVNFQFIHGYSINGGVDSATLSDNTGVDAITVTPTVVNFWGTNFFRSAKSFESVTVNGTPGQNNTASFFDSGGTDTFIAKANPLTASLTTVTNAFSIQTTGFRQVTATSNYKADTAQLYDSTGNDNFTATPTQATLSGTNYQFQVNTFRYVHGYATSGGFDQAFFYDSAGADTFTAAGTTAALSDGTTYYNRARFFDAAHAYAVNGGVDVANMSGSSGTDEFTGQHYQSIYEGPGFYNRARFFEQVYATRTPGGSDRAFLYDAPGGAHLNAAGNAADVSSPAIPYFVQATDFARVTAVGANNPNGNSKTVGAITFDLVLVAWP